MRFLDNLDRPSAYRVAGRLLPPGPISVIDLDCRDGRGKFYLGREDEITYLGLEKNRMRRAATGADVRIGFNWVERDDTPGGFDAAICLLMPRWNRPGVIAWRLGQLVKKGGVVILGLKRLGDRERLKEFFAEVRVFQSSGVQLAVCLGAKSAEEIAA